MHLTQLTSTAALVTISEQKAHRDFVTTAGSWHAAEVADNKYGAYLVSFKPDKAGSFQLVLSMEGEPRASAHKRTYTGTCVADVAAAEKCAISGVMTQLVAGQHGKLTLTRADRSVNTLLQMCTVRFDRCGTLCWCAILRFGTLIEQAATPEACLFTSRCIANLPDPEVHIVSIP